MSSTPKTDANFSSHALEQVVPQLDNLSLADLRKLAEILQAKTKQVEQQERERAVEQIKSIATGVGMSIPEILAFKPTGIGSTAVYRNPKNHSETWAGKGARPKWVKEWIEANGDNLDAIRI